MHIRINTDVYCVKMKCTRNTKLQFPIIFSHAAREQSIFAFIQMFSFREKQIMSHLQSHFPFVRQWQRPRCCAWRSHCPLRTRCQRCTGATPFPRASRTPRESPSLRPRPCVTRDLHTPPAAPRWPPRRSCISPRHSRRRSTRGMARRGDTTPR